MEELELLRQRSEILGMNYWEQFKFEKELAMTLSPEHPKRKQIHSQTAMALQEWSDARDKLKEYEDGNK